MSSDIDPVATYNEVRIVAKELYQYLRKHQKIQYVPHCAKLRDDEIEKASKEIGRTPSHSQLSLWSRSTVDERENGFYKMQCAASPTDEHAKFLLRKFPNYNWTRSVKGS